MSTTGFKQLALFMAKMMALLMIIQVVRAEDCMKITDKEDVKECEEVDCSCTLGISREQWLWSCTGAHTRTFCYSIKRDLFDVNEYIPQINAANLTYEILAKENLGPTYFVNSVEEAISELTGIPSDDDEESEILVKRGKKLNCEKHCKSADEFMRHCQKNGVSVAYEVLKAACYYACIKYNARDSPGKCN